MATTNELLRDALTRHQVELLAMSNGVRNRVTRLLDATETDLRDQVARRLAAGATPARAESLIRRVKAVRSAAFESVRGVWTSEMAELAEAEAGFLSEALSATSPVTLDTALPSARQLRAIATSRPLRGATLVQWADRLKASDLRRLEGQIRIGLTQGETAQEISRRLFGSAALRGADGVTQITRNHAQSLARTAVIDVSNQTKRDFYKANSDIIDSEVWLATLDDRTCPVCGGRDGEQFPVGEGPIPPAHMQCRCVRVAALAAGVLGDRPLKRSTEKDLLKEFSAKEGLGTVRSRAALPRGFKGKFDKFARTRVRELTGTAPAKTTYEEFLRAQSRNFQERVLGTEKARLFREGKMPLDKFRVGERELSLRELRRLDLEDLGGLDVAFPQVGQRVESLLARGLSNQETADAVRREFPNVATTAKSVASVKSTLKRSGVEFPASRVDLEASSGATQAIADLESGLPSGFEPPANWARTTPTATRPGVYGTFVQGEGVTLADDAMKVITRQQARQVASHELGHFMHRAGGLSPSADDLSALRASVSRLDKGDLKRYGYYLATEDELIAEIYSQALSPSPVTSQGLSAARFSEVFAEDIARAKARLSGGRVVALPKAPTPPQFKAQPLPSTTPKAPPVPPKVPVVAPPLPAVESRVASAVRIEASADRLKDADLFMGKKQPRLSLDGANSALRKAGAGNVTEEAQRVISGYTNNGYAALNRLLRGERPFGVEFSEVGTAGSTVNRRFSSAVSAMDDALEALPKFNGGVNRFMRLEGPRLDDLLSRYSNGAVVQESAYVSATRGGSSALKKAGVFDAEPNITVKIASRNGREINPALSSLSTNEREVVFARGSSFRVTGVRKTREAKGSSPAFYEIDMEETAALLQDVAPLRRVPASAERKAFMQKFMGDTSSVLTLDELNVSLSKAGLGKVTEEAQRVLSSYTASGYGKLNRALRGDITFKKGGTGAVTLDAQFAGLSKAGTKTHEYFSSAVSAMDDALQTLPIHKGQTTRFMLVEGDGLKDLVSRYRKGATIEELAYTSATHGDGSKLLTGGLLQFDPNIVFRIKSKSGRRVPREFTSLAIDEEEVIFGRGSKFRVAEIKQTRPPGTKTANGRNLEPAYEITMEEF